MMALQEAIQMQMENPNGYNSLPDDVKASVEYSAEKGMPFIAKQTGTEVVKYDKSIKNHPTAEIVNSQNVIVDPTCNGDLSAAQFVIYSFETSKSDLEKDGRYSNLDQISDGMSSPLNTPDHVVEDRSGFNFKDEPRKKFIAYEYWGWWDIHNTGKTVPIVATYVAWQELFILLSSVENYHRGTIVWKDRPIARADR